MSTKTYDGQSGKLVAAIATAIPKTLSGDRMQYWIDNPSELQKFLSGLLDSEKAEKAEAPLFTISTTFHLAAVPAKRQKDCFADKKRWSYRDGCLDSYFKKDQDEAGDCDVAIAIFHKEWHFREFAAAVLGAEWAAKSLKEIGEEIIRRGLTLTCAQAEAMVEATERGEKTDMRTDGYANFYFTETGDVENPVAVGVVLRDDPRWDAYAYRLGDGNRWLVELRFLLRNLKVA
jgi:hypothetical protein